MHKASVKKMSKIKKQFDFTKSKQRYIALKILYFGWDYDGLATQGDSEKTIEYHLFKALTKTCLVESRSKCNYNRCGRTDKGVSSYGQVVNLSVRSNLIDEDDPQNVGLFTPEQYCPTEKSITTKGDAPRQEINYVMILNKVLPDHIKAIAWAPVKRDFSSRFNCQCRSYSYIFPLGNLCIESMKKALVYLIGEHDFRNLCSFDLKNGVVNHKRTILSASIEPIVSISERKSHTAQAGNGYSFYKIVIVGQAFLYHQIRCIMTILFLVGTKKEPPEVLRDLLDTQKCTGRPNYNLASPINLSLFECKYSPDDLPLGWNYDQDALYNLIRQLKHLWTIYKTKSMMIEQVLVDLQPTIKTPCDAQQETKNSESDLGEWKDFGVECDNMSDTKYIPLLKRPRDETLESKLKTMDEKKKKKLDIHCDSG